MSDKIDPEVESWARYMCAYHVGNENQMVLIGEGYKFHTPSGLVSNFESRSAVPCWHAWLPDAEHIVRRLKEGK